MKTKPQTLENLRKEYRAEQLSEKDVKSNPIEQFDHWFDEALKSGIYEPNAMTLATATPDGKPSARIVLLKGFNQDGFVFYTNYLTGKKPGSFFGILLARIGTPGSDRRHH